MSAWAASGASYPRLYLFSTTFGSLVCRPPSRPSCPKKDLPVPPLPLSRRPQRLLRTSPYGQTTGWGSYSSSLVYWARFDSFGPRDTRLMWRECTRHLLHAVQG